MRKVNKMNSLNKRLTTENEIKQGKLKARLATLEKIDVERENKR